MLSMESEEMFDLASNYIDEHSLEQFYEDVFVPALRLAEEDRHSGALAEVRERFILQSSRELIEELERKDEISPGTDGSISSAAQPGSAVLAIPARDDADELVAMMLCQLLRRRGIPAAVRPLGGLPAEEFGTIDGI